jgi:hypothetical protein
LRWLTAVFVVVVFFFASEASSSSSSAAEATTTTRIRDSDLAETGAATAATEAAPNATAASMEENRGSAPATRANAGASPSVRVVFSDVDGTLVHYRAVCDEDDDDDDNAASGASRLEKESGDGPPSLPLQSPPPSLLVSLPPSATGAVGILSRRTLRLCREIRRREVPPAEQGEDANADEGGRRVKLVLVSGMRTSTLLRRLPFLPRADAYCSEGGSRIFYPVAVVPRPSTETGPRRGGRIVPVRWDGEENEEDDFLPFDVVEDETWRRRIASVVGDDGYVGNELYDLCENGGDKESSTRSGRGSLIPVAERSGPLWAFGNELERRGYVLDTAGYAACFRINRKQQPRSVDFDFDALLRRTDGGGDAEGSSFEVPPGLGTSTNLGCVDVYAAISGKKNW